MSAQPTSAELSMKESGRKNRQADGKQHQAACFRLHGHKISLSYLAVSVLWLRELATYRTGSWVNATGYGPRSIRCAAGSKRITSLSRSVWSCSECRLCVCLKITDNAAARRRKWNRFIFRSHTASDRHQNQKSK